MTAPIVLRLPFPQLSARNHADVTVLSLSGELDFLAVPALLACLHATLERPRSVADLADLAFIDCACLSVLVRHSAQIRARDGSFALAGPQGAVRRALSVTGLISWFEVHDTVGQAVAGGCQEAAAPPAPGRSWILASDRGAALDPVQPALIAALQCVTGVTTAPNSTPAMTAFPDLSSAGPAVPGPAI
jgi:anti-sigma B factor antagonist